MPECSTDRSSRRQAATGSSRGRWLAFALVAGACPQPGTETTASGESTTSGAQTTADESTTAAAATGAGSPTTGGEASSGIVGECPDLDDSTTGVINPQVVEECDALCARYAACGLKEHALCQMGCVAKFGEDREECYEAGSAARACLTAMTCEELGEYLQFNKGGPCAKPLKAQYEECTCQSQTGWHTGADACVYNLDCPYLPFRRMICDEGVCACHVGDEVVKTCPQGDTCKIDLWAMAESCCCMVR